MLILNIRPVLYNPLSLHIFLESMECLKEKIFSFWRKIYENQTLSLLASECNATLTAFDMIFFVRSELITVFSDFNPSIVKSDTSILLIFRSYSYVFGLTKKL